ncbi:class I adenylate-forming enzyme family protein (plasmid) [Burkholderia gladioli pv. gladioli]|uniref:class I adenylate-forming enzyme family protein n=1 Tax=Burkholderia gladioli TaxID=28095 RepID=UPI0019366498|nr:class I adenylate-forming enzyme family protein [Burkholderia gladioli]MDJ1167669.1 class I adenylate-forming enzyme family protein [Burkholderia gladioli pv. gladioli]QPQ88857.1 acyl--CoA ligase [Burkholderia gladioli]
MADIVDLDGFLDHLERNSHGRLYDIWSGEASGVAFSSLVEAARAWQRYFRKLNVESGMPVLIPMRIGLSSVGMLLGALQYGLLPVLVKPTTPVNLMCEIVGNIGGGFLVATSATKPVFLELGYSAPGEGFGEFHMLLAPPEYTSLKMHPPDSIGIPSSGSTGAPKVIIQPLSNLLRNASMHAAAVKLDASDTVVLNLPLNYSYGLVAGLLATLLVGAKGVLLDQQRVDIRRALNAFDATTCMGTPSSVLENFPVDYFGKVKRLMVGGDVMRPRLASSLLNAVKDTEIFATYGLTEAGPRVATWRLEAERILHYRAIPLGVPLTNVRLSLGENDRDGTCRELLIDTPTVMHGYLGDEAGTRAVLERPGGTLRTGDMFEERDGHLFFAGRLKRVIVRGGENIYPAFVEGVVMRFPDIEDVWVTGEAHEGLGQVPIAYLIARKLIDVRVLARELRRYLPSSHIPTKWEQVRAFPSNIRK